MKKLTIIFLVVFIIFSILVGINILYQPHKDIANTDADYKMNAKEIYENFTSNETAALKKLSNKVIESEGKITAIDTKNKNLVIDSLLFYQFDDALNSDLKINQTIKIKARLIGYDELMNEIILLALTIH